MKTCSLLFLVAALSLIAGCGETQSGEPDERTAARISEKAGVAYKEKITDWSDWNPWQPFTSRQRRELDPLQMDWLDLVHSSMQEIHEFNERKNNPLAREASKKKTYDKQKKQMKTLLNKIHQQGLNNWPMSLEENGLAFAPGMVSWPAANNNFELQEGHLLGLILSGGRVQSLEGLLTKELTGSLSLDQLNETSSDTILTSETGDTVYVTLPPGTFEIRQVPSLVPFFGAGPNYHGNTVMAVYHHGDREGEIDLCYTPWLLVVKKPEYLRITTRRDKELLHKMTKAVESDNHQRDLQNQQRVKQALKLVADQLVKDFQETLEEKYKKSSYGRTHYIRSHANHLRSQLQKQLDIDAGSSNAPHLGHSPNLKKGLAVLKEQKVPLTELYKDPRIAHITAPSYTSGDYGHGLKSPEPKYAKMMQPFTSEYEGKMYDLVRCNLHTGKYVVKEVDLQKLQQKVKTGYRKRRPYEQGIVHTKKDVEMYEKLRNTLQQQYKAGNVTIFDEEGKSVAWK